MTTSLRYTAASLALTLYQGVCGYDRILVLPFPSSSAKYLGEREGDLTKEGGGKRKKSYSRCHATL